MIQQQSNRCTRVTFTCMIFIDLVYVTILCMSLPMTNIYVARCGHGNNKLVMYSAVSSDMPDFNRGMSQVMMGNGNGMSNINASKINDSSMDTSGNVRRAPRVDSQLLRYVATNEIHEEPRNNMNDKNITNEESKPLSLPAVSVSLDSSSSSSSTPISASPDTRSVDSATVSPFQRLNMFVTSSLMHNGAGADEAQKAANAVEAHTLERFRRRQLRLYMKARDDSWSNFFQNEAVYALDMCSEDQTNLLLQQDFVSTAGFKNERIDGVLKQLFDAGLNGKDCAAVLAHTPSLALSKDGNVKEGVEYAMVLLRRDLALRRYDARKVIRLCPGLLTAQGANSAAQIVDMLSSLGVSRSSLARDKSQLPLMLSRQPGALFRLAAFLASNLIRLPTDRVGPLLRRPECLPLLDSVVPLEYILKLQASKQIDSAVLSQMVREEIDGKYRKMSK